MIAGRQPLQRSGIPDIAGAFAIMHAEIAREIDEEQRTPAAIMKAPMVEIRFSVPSHIGGIGVDAARHAHQPGMCIGKKVMLTPTNISQNTHRPSRSDSGRLLAVGTQ